MASVDEARDTAAATAGGEAGAAGSSARPALRGASALADAGGPIVLYDGVCGLCNRTVTFILPRDPAGRIRFAPLQGPLAAEILARHGVPVPEGAPESIVLVEAPGTPAERLSFRSTGALRIARWLAPPWSWLGALRAVPRPLRDWVYDRVARSRYRVFGTLDACPVPAPEHRARFLE